MAKLRDVKYLGTIIGTTVGVVGGAAITIFSGGTGLAWGLRFASLSASAGYYVDNRIRNSFDEQGPLPQLRVSGSRAGTPAPWIWGTVRVPGYVLYASKMRAEDSAEKGKSSQDRTGDRYFVDVAIAWCRSECPEDFLVDLYANGASLIKRGGDAINISIGPNLAILSGGAVVGLTSGGTTDKLYSRLTIDVILPGTDPMIAEILNLRSGMEVTVAGVDFDPDILGTHTLLTVLEVTTPGTPRQFIITFKVCQYRYDEVGFQTFPILPATCPEQSSVPLNTGTVTLTTVPDADYSPYFDPADVTYYRGTTTQSIDPLLEAAHPIATPAYRGTCYMVIPNFEVTKFAGMLPEFEGIIKQADTTNVAKIIKELTALSESEAAFLVETDQQNAPNCLGFTHLAPATIAQSIVQLMDVYDYRMSESFRYQAALRIPEFSIRYFRAVDADVITVPVDEASARPAGVVGNRRPVIGQNDPKAMNSELVIAYQDADQSYNVGASSYTNPATTLQSKLSIRYNTILDAKTAEAIVKRMTWQQITRSSSAQFNLPPSRFGIMPSDQTTIIDAEFGDIETVVFSSSTGANGLNAVQAYIDQTQTSDQPPGVITKVIDDSLDFLGQPIAVSADLPPLFASEASRFGVYLGLTNSIGSTVGDIYVSADQVVWELVAARGTSAVTGIVQNAIGDVCGVYWDTTNTIQVQLDNVASSLVSIDDELVAQGRNWCVISGEIIGFANVAPQGDGLFHLSRLLRGRRDSHRFIGTHVAEELFAMLPVTGPGFLFEDINPSRYLVTTYVRAVGPGQSVDTANSALDVVVRPAAESLRPFAPTGLWAHRYTNNRVCLWCVDKTRVPFRLFGQSGPIFVETGDAEKWVAEVYWDDGGGLGLIRTLVGCRSSPLSDFNRQIVFEYTQQQQIEDFHATGKITDGSYPNPLVFKVFRISDSKGDGRDSQLTVLGPGVYWEDCS